VGRVHVPSRPSHSSNRGTAALESLPKLIVHYPTRSLDLTLPHIGKLMKYGQITLGYVRPVGRVAVAHDGPQTVSMLLRREGEAVTQLLTRPDLAIAQASLRASPPTRSTRSTRNTSPRNICPLPILGGHFRTQTRCQSGLKRSFANELKASEKQIFVAHSILVALKTFVFAIVTQLTIFDWPELRSPTHQFPMRNTTPVRSCRPLDALMECTSGSQLCE